jgi:hypothetical protein
MVIKEMTYDFKLRIDTSSSVNLVQGSQNAVGYNTKLGDLDPSQKSSITEEEKPTGDGKTNDDGKKPDNPTSPQNEGGTQQTPEKEKGNTDGTKGNTPDDKKTEGNGEKGSGTQTKKKSAAAEQASAKDNVKVDKTFGVSYSSKRDSSSTQNSRYSVETSMDVKLVIGPDSMPGGISKLLEILNESIEVYNPNGELTVSANRVQLVNGYAIVSAEYINTDGLLALGEITCTKTEGGGNGVVKFSSNGNNVQMLFNEAGTYIIKAGKLSQTVIVDPEFQEAQEESQEESQENE